MSQFARRPVLLGLLATVCLAAIGLQAAPIDDAKKHQLEVDALVREIRATIDANNDKLSHFQEECMEALGSEAKLRKYLADIERMVVSCVFARSQALRTLQNGLECRSNMADASKLKASAFDGARESWLETKSEQWIRQVDGEDRPAIGKLVGQIEALLSSEYEQIVGKPV